MKIFILALALLMASENFASELFLSEEEKQNILEQSLDKIASLYVDESRREEIVDAIKQKDRANPYRLLESSKFVEKLTADLRAVSSDDHLYLRVTDASAGPRRMLPGDPADYLSAELLDNNVGYIDVRIFGMGEASLLAIDQAMSLVKDSRALIIDLRRCRGGAVTGVEHLLSYLTTNSEHYLTSVNTAQGWVSERSLNPQNIDSQYQRPIYVLTGTRTFSAGEDFAYSVRLLDIATLVGLPTRGGGYMNMLFPVHESVRLSVSIGRTFNPENGEGWQGIGIAPDVEMPEESALEYVLSRITQTKDSRDHASDKV